ncbi:MAG: CBS domain-containing protein [Planctomycetes bacterium]|nr:CBS domain-containing protein [Planctomycetota bacterium]
MLVRELMSSPVETLDHEMACAAAGEYFKAHRLRRAPVVEDGRVIGMLTYGDLARALPLTVAAVDQGTAHPAYHRKVSSLLKTALTSVAPNDSVEQAAQLMLRDKVGALPVLEEGLAVGIITESDIFKLFVRRGLTQPGHRLLLRAPTKTLAELDPSAVAVGAEARLFDLSIFPMGKDRVAVSLQVQTEDLDGLIDALLAAHYELVLVETC